MALLNENALIVGLIGDEDHGLAQHVLQDMRLLDARLAAVSESGAGLAVDGDYRMQSGLPLLWRAPLYLLFPQLLAYHRAVAERRDPDRPLHLSSVVVLHE
jgi:fructoselysine-6-P-deglycase FrlB-like protein